MTGNYMLRKLNVRDETYCAQECSSADEALTAHFLSQNQGIDFNFEICFMA
jgi:hypothetical protein